MQKNKILIEEREDGTLIGLSRDGVDPYVKKVGLTWEQTIAQLPFLKGMTDIAEEQWKLSPKNPIVHGAAQNRSQESGTSEESSTGEERRQDQARTACVDCL